MAWHKCVVLETTDGWIVRENDNPPIMISAKKKESAIAAALRIARETLSDTEADDCVQVTFQLKAD